MTLNLHAQHRTSEELQDIAAQQLLDAGVKAHVSSQRSAVQHLGELSITENLAIYGSEDAGFVVLALDSRLKPVLGVSLNPYTPGQEPSGFLWWLEQQEAALAYASARMNAGVQAPQWDETEEEGNYIAVPNLISSKWGQSDPYNLYCPKIKGSNSLTGCTATAVAQILRYNQYPTHSTGKSKYFVGNSQSGIPVTLNSTFDYSLMTNTYPSKRTDEQRNAVATLMRECGYAFKMNYSTESSGAYDTDVALGLTTNLGYDTLAIQLLQRDVYTDEEWLAIIQDELLANRPMYYSAMDPNRGGHAFIVSGIDTEGKVYINWGWNGDADGYFAIDNMSPRGILGTASSNFSQYHAIICGFTPDGKPLDDAEYTERLALADTLTLSSSSANLLTINFPGIYNVDYLPFYGEVYVYIENEDDESIFDIQRLFTTADPQLGSLTPGYGLRETSLDYPVSELPAGNYSFVVLSHAVQHDYFNLVRSVGGLYIVKFSKDENGVITTQSPSLYDSIKEVKTEQPAPISPLAPSLTGFFDLNGRSLRMTDDKLRMTNLPKGIYIINGKKVMVK